MSFIWFIELLILDFLDVIEHSYYEEALELLKSRPKIEFSFDVMLEEEAGTESKQQNEQQFEDRMVESIESQEVAANARNNFIPFSRTNSLKAMTLSRQSSDSNELEEHPKFDLDYNEKASFSLPPLVQQSNRNYEDLEEGLPLNQREDGRLSSMSSSSSINNNSTTYFPKIDSRFLPK